MRIQDLAPSRARASVFFFHFLFFYSFLSSSVLCSILVSDALLLMSCHDMRVRWNIRANVCNQLNVLVRLCGFCLRFFRMLPHFDLFAVRIETYWRQSPSPPSSPNRFVCAFETLFVIYADNCNTKMHCLPLTDGLCVCCLESSTNSVAYVYLCDENQLESI